VERSAGPGFIVISRASRDKETAIMTGHDRHSWQQLYNAKITEAGHRLERLLRLVPALHAEVKHDLERSLDDVRGRLNRASAKVEGLRRANDDGWRSAKDQADHAFDALSEAFEVVEARFPPLLLAA